jgi:hypothetical protein
MATRKFNLITDAIDLAAMEPAKGLGPDVFLAELKQDNYVLIVLDTWARMLWASGGNDSDQQVVGPAIAGCDRIRKALGCTVIMVAHVGVSKDAQRRAKGLSDPAGAIDGGTLCVKKGDGPEATYSFEAVYQRFAADGFTLTAALRKTGPNVALVYEKTLKIPLTKRERAIYDRLRELGDGTSMDAWREAVRNTNVIPGKEGKPAGADTVRKAVKRVSDKLERAGQIEISNGMVTFPDDGEARAEFEDADEGDADE